MYERFGKPILAILFVILVIEIIIVAPKILEYEEKPTDDVAQVGDTIEQAMQGAHLVETRAENKKWELWAEQALNFKDSETWRLDRVKSIFFSDKAGTFTVTGDRGHVEEGTRNVIIEGNVVTRSNNGYVFKTDKVSYDSEKQILHSSNPLEMSGPKDPEGTPLHLTGVGMEAHLERDLIEVKSNVVANKIFAKQRKMNLKSQRAEFSNKNYSARFLDQVVMDLDSPTSSGMEAMRITGPEATFSFDPEKDQMTSVTMKGGVKVTDSEKWATSDNLRVDFLQNSFAFDGKPRVVRDNEELRGEKIVFLDGGKRVKIVNARARMEKKSLERSN